MITKKEFAGLKPKMRGYVVYMAGCRKDQPNVPDEKNPYIEGSKAASEWDLGQAMGILEAQDNP